MKFSFNYSFPFITKYFTGGIALIIRNLIHIIHVYLIQCLSCPCAFFSKKHLEERNVRAFLKLANDGSSFILGGSLVLVRGPLTSSDRAPLFVLHMVSNNYGHAVHHYNFTFFTFSFILMHFRSCITRVALSRLLQPPATILAVKFCSFCTLREGLMGVCPIFLVHN